jgi:glycosyltransferase involved in cell wall biosynthesis
MTRLHVAIAALCGPVGGPATYARRLGAALTARDDVRVSVLTDRPGDFAGVEVVPLPTRGGVDRLRWQYVAVPHAVRRLRPDVFHDTKNALPFLLPCPAAVTVHDLAYHTTPTTFGRFSRAFLKAATADAVRRARAIVVPSQATAADLRRIHPATAGRIHVVPHGIDAAPRPDAATLAAARQRLCLPERFVLHVGTVQARKNVDLVVAGVQELRRRGFPHRVVVVGRDGWRADAALAALRADATAVRIPHAAPADLAAIYALADAFCSPSAYEGFGFAVADALAAGVPTVVSDVSSLPELCGDAAVRLPRLDALAVADALAAVLGDDAVRARLAAAGPRRAADFAWSAAADGHVRAWRAALAARA